MVVAEYRTAGGALVRIHDDYMVPRESEEGRRIIAEQQRIARQIMEGWTRRKMEEQNNGKIDPD